MQQRLFSTRLQAFEKRVQRDLQKRRGIRVQVRHVNRPQRRLDRWDAIARLLDAGMTPHQIGKRLRIDHVGNSLAAMAHPVRIGWNPRQTSRRGGRVS